MEPSLSVPVPFLYRSHCVTPLLCNPNPKPRTGTQKANQFYNTLAFLQTLPQLVGPWSPPPPQPTSKALLPNITAGAQETNGSKLAATQTTQIISGPLAPALTTHCNTYASTNKTTII